MWRTTEDKDDNPIKLRNFSKWWSIIAFPLMGSYLIDIILSLPEVGRILNDKEQFDLILGETVLDEAFIAGFSYKHKAPIVAINTFLPGTFANLMVIF